MRHNLRGRTCLVIRETTLLRLASSGSTVEASSTPSNAHGTVDCTWTCSLLGCHMGTQGTRQDARQLRHMQHLFPFETGARLVLLCVTLIRAIEILALALT